MGAPKTPEPTRPGEAAQAATGAAAAGEMMSVANQPVEQYANLATTSELGPAEMQTQQALQGQAAYRAAQQQQDIQSRVDPQAYAQRQMRMQAANRRLAELYGVNPSDYTYRAPEAYQVAGTADVAPLGELRQRAADIASQLSTASLSKKGTNPILKSPQDPDQPTVFAGRSYF